MVLGEPYLWIAIAAAVWLILVGWPVAVPDDRPLSPVAIGYLRRGERGAINTAAFLLFTMGLVRVTHNGALARGNAPSRSGLDPFAAAVYAAMPGPTGLRGISTKPRVRAALRTLVRELAQAGMVPGRVRWPLARLALVAIASAAAIGLADPDRGPAERIAYLGVLLLVAIAWLLRRRSIAGHRRLHAVKRQQALVAAPPAGAQRVPVEPDAVTAFAAGDYALSGGIGDAYLHSQAGRRDGWWGDLVGLDWLDAGHGSAVGTGSGAGGGSDGSP